MQTYLYIAVPAAPAPRRAATLAPTLNPQPVCVTYLIRKRMLYVCAGALAPTLNPQPVCVIYLIRKRMLYVCAGA